jgi:hypothetical protein
MDNSIKIILVILFLIIDMATIYIPMTPVVLVIILLAKPDWFKKFVDELYLKK